ncbi:MAG: two-component system response regulator [Acidobacteriota bacterium]
MEAVSVLSVSPTEDDRVLLAHVFSHSNWTLEHVRSCAEAIAAAKRGDVGVIISAAELPDGSWHDIFNAVKDQPAPPRIIVVSNLADDRLWADVLDLGGYDVLGKPFEQNEVIRVVSLAWRQWKHERDVAAGDLHRTAGG